MLSERCAHMIQLSRHPPAWRQRTYSAAWVSAICASFHCASKSSSSRNQRCAGCLGAVELSVRCILLTVPSVQSVLESAKETGEYCRARNFISVVMQKDGFECCLHPALPPEGFLGLRQGRVPLLLWQSCGRAAPLFASKQRGR